MVNNISCQHQHQPLQAHSASWGGSAPIAIATFDQYTLVYIDDGSPDAALLFIFVHCYMCDPPPGKQFFWWIGMCWKSCQKCDDYQADWAGIWILSRIDHIVSWHS